MIDWSFEQIACDILDTTLEKIKSKSKGTTKTAMARYICFNHLKHETVLSLSEIGKRYGDRDHATVHNGLKRYQEFIDSKDKVFNKAVKEFNEIVPKVEFKESTDTLNSEQIRTCIFMHKQGIKISRIASFYKVNTSIIEEITDTMIWKKVNPGIIRGVMHEYNKPNRMTFKEMSIKYKVAESTICNIVKKHKKKNDRSRK